jgi:solute carrier family 25 (mitochondrial phosphate transporter), member 23/24/25/41
MIDPKLAEIFQKYDLDNSKTININELGTALGDLGVRRSEKELKELLESIDNDKSGELDFEEFVLLFGEAKLESVFKEMDYDNSNSINANELGQALEKLGHKLPSSEIKSILNRVDRDHSGEVSFDEFREFFKYVPAANLASIAKAWMNSTSIDCGSDIAPPITGPDVPWYYGIFGGLGGILSRTLTAPLEKVKIVAQTSSSPVSMSKELANTYKTLGIRGLFAGNAANCLRVFPYASIVTYCYLNGLKLTPADSTFDAYEPLYRGSVAACAGIVGQLVTYPIDVVRARMTVVPEHNQSVLGSFRNIVRSEGLKGLYRGLFPTIAAVSPFLACQMSTADAGKSIAAEYGIQVTTPVMLCISSAAGLTAQTIVYPLDVLRRRMQVQSGSTGAIQNASVISDTTWTALQQVVRREGFKSLFNGILPTYAKVLPSVAIAMTTTKELIGLSQQYK